MKDEKDNQGFYLTFFELKEASLKKFTKAFRLGVDGLLRYQGLLCVLNVDDQ